MRLQPDQILLGCKVINKIAEGGMGEVYLAKDEKLKRKVAIKVMHAKMKGDAGERFQREAETRPNLIIPASFKYIVLESMISRLFLLWNMWMAHHLPDF